MPTLDLEKSYVDKNFLGSHQNFEDICFNFGVELDDTVKDAATDKIIYKIDIPPNRLDLLCPEGLIQNLNVYSNKSSIPLYKVSVDQEIKMIVNKNVKDIRPYIRCALLKDVSLNKDSFKNFINYQEKLHSTIAKHRTLASIGTHDFDKIAFPFYYSAQDPSNTSFVALKQKESMNSIELFKILKKDLHLGKYLHIIEKNQNFPYVLDKNGNVLSLPPIINSSLSQIDINTKNILIEVTGTDLQRVEIVFKCIVANYSQYCRNQFSVTQIPVVYDSNHQETTNLIENDVAISVSEICQSIGIEKDVKTVNQSLQRMSIKSIEKDGLIVASIPWFRSDVINKVDIIADVATGYGLSNVKLTVPKLTCLGSHLPLTKLVNALRIELSQCNIKESLTFTLCSKDDISTNLLEDWSVNSQNIALKIDNPKTFEFQVIRTTLIPGLLKTISSNRSLKLPISIFEISDVVHLENNCNLLIFIE
ncbi:MAG: hypothetical protein MHPSP_001829 [Paramarteilia canceri]